MRGVDEEQERRFQARVNDPMRRWKLSPMDLQSRARWVEYSRAKDEMFRYTDIKHAPWYVVQADDKRRARLNCIAHLLKQIPYKDLTTVEMELPPRQPDEVATASPKQQLDPVGENLVGTRRLVERYNALGLTRIETHYYPGARHEVLNETNRDEVQRDVLAWLAKTM